MIKPIKNLDEIDEKLIAEMSRECISKEYLQKFFTTEMNEIFLLMITQEQVILIKAIYDEKLHHQDIARTVFSIIGGTTKTLLVHAYSDGKDKGFFRNFNNCSRNNYCKNMKDTYDLFEKFVEKIENKECEYYIDDYGLSYNDAVSNSNQKDRKIYGAPVDEVKRIFKEFIQENNYDKDYAR